MSVVAYLLLMVPLLGLWVWVLTARPARGYSSSPRPIGKLPKVPAGPAPGASRRR